MNATSELNSTTLLCFGGLSCALLAISVFFAQSLSITSQVCAVPLLMLTTGCTVLWLLLASFLKDFLCQSRGSLVCEAIALLGCATTIPAFILTDYSIFFAPVIAAGITAYIVLWTHFLVRQKHVALLFVTAGAFAFTALIVALTFSANRFFAITLIVVAAVVSSLCARLLQSESGGAELLEAGATRPCPSLKKGNRFTLLALGFSLGGALVIGGAIELEQAVITLVFGTVMLVACLSVLLLRQRRTTVFENSARRAIAVFALAALLPFPFLPAAGQLACASILLFGSVVNIIILIDAIVETSRLRHITPSWIVGREGSLFMFGVTSAASVFWFCLIYLDSSQAQVWSCVGFALTFIALQVFIENQTYPFFDEELPGRIDVSDGLPLAGKPSAKGGASWRGKLDATAERYNLSPRQKEVMKLLCKGRNVLHIMDYFVISRSTAKTHIYNIYKRLGVHSRQELLDLIEQMPVDEDGASSYRTFLKQP